MLRKLNGLIFISTKGIENSWPFQWYQLIPCKSQSTILEVAQINGTVWTRKGHFRVTVTDCECKIIVWRWKILFSVWIFFFNLTGAVVGQNPNLRSSSIMNFVQLYSHTSHVNPPHHQNLPLCSFTPRGNFCLHAFMPVHLCSHLDSFHVMKRRSERYRAQQGKQWCSKTFVVSSNHSFTQHLTVFLKPFQHEAEKKLHQTVVKRTPSTKKALNTHSLLMWTEKLCPYVPIG